jgi:hypothetical protein
MTNQSLLDRIGGRVPDIRAADADRERTADRLREAHGEGRLDLAEFQERLERCYEAKTVGELGALVSDLPRQHEREPDHRRSDRLLRPGLWVLAPLLFALIAVSAATGHHVVWVWFPLAFLFVWRISSWRRRRWSPGHRRGPDDWL